MKSRTKKRKILYISGSRADFGLMKQTLRNIKDHPKLTLEIAATGMHLMDEFGRTVSEIRNDGFKVREIKATYDNNNKGSMTDFIGTFMLKISKTIASSKPDIILLLGDRAEMLGAAIAGAYLAIPVAHIHGGDISSTADDTVRHAITKLSHIHFPATKRSAERITGMGERKNRIFITGAPGLDDIFSGSYTSPIDISRKYNLDLSKPVLVVIQHPVTNEIEMSARQMSETMESIKELGQQSIVIYPNADAGSRPMIKVIEKYRKYQNIRIFRNIPRQDYIGLMKVASALIGNSSSGIIESASFRLPAINIGSRQNGRERYQNVTDVLHNKKQITASIRKALFDKTFLQKIKRCRNPYGNGKAGIKIADVLSRIEMDKDFLQKSSL